MKKLIFYRCSVCGNVAVKLVDSGVPMVCCGRPMNEIKANTTDASQEKHVPVVEVKGKVVNVKIGSVPHPMVEEHYIQFVEVNSPDKRYVKRKYLYPNEEPVLKLKCDCKDIIARELCNIHGVWSSQDK